MNDRLSKPPKLIRPAQPFEIEETQPLSIMDIAERMTDPMSALRNPTTPVPPALDIRPFFSGRLPLPPSVNEAYKVIRFTTADGRQVHRLGSTPELEQFKKDAAKVFAHSSWCHVDWSVLNALRSARTKTPLRVCVRGYFVSMWKRDLDGILKFVIDATFDFLQLNDNRVTKLEAEKLVDDVDPRAEIEVSCVVQ